MKKVLNYEGESEAFTLLDQLLSSTSALGEGFNGEISNIYFHSFYVDNVGAKEAVEARIANFVETYTKKITIFDSKFIQEIAYLLREGVKDQCKKYPLKTT